MKLFNDHVYDEVMLVYNQFKNAATYLIQTEQYLPVVQLQTKPVAVPAVSYIFEPSADQILGDLIPRTLKIQLYKAILDSWTSEHGARMTAMHKATDNANELLKQLQLSYNKARQAAITNEIIEIVSGVNALHNQ
jgi:F-type H+-transporting ATPase subunit gamma